MITFPCGTSLRLLELLLDCEDLFFVFSTSCTLPSLHFGNIRVLVINQFIETIKLLTLGAART